jgi:hypothetical protein
MKTMENPQKKMVRTQVKKIGGSLAFIIPKTIIEMMDFKEGDIVKVPFLEFEKVDKEEETKLEDEDYKPNGKEEILVKLKRHKSLTITQDDIIKALSDATPEMEQYKSAYIVWDGKRYGLKKVFEKVLGFKDFNTIQGERIAVELGFKTGRE